MRWIFVPLIAGLITASYAGSPQIPPAEKPFAVCLYKALKSMPGITGVDVYVLEKTHPSHPDIVLAYGYRDGEGAEASNDIVLTLPPAGRYEYVGDFTQPDNPVNKAFKALDTTCGVDSGYVDQSFSPISPSASIWVIRASCVQQHPPSACFDKLSMRI